VDHDLSAQAFVARLRGQIAAEPRTSVFAVMRAAQRWLAGRREQLRIEHDPSADFHPGDIADIRVAADGDIVLRTTFLGLTGTVSPLSGDLVAAARHSPAICEVLDVIHTRLLALLHQGLTDIDYARSCRRDRRDPTSQHLLTLTDRLGPALALHERLRILPLLPTRVRTARGLAAAITAVFAADLGDATVEVVEHIARSTHLTTRTSLGRTAAALSASFVLGGAVHDPRGWFRVAIGPVAAAHAPGFMRTGPVLVRLCAVIRALVEPGLNFEIAVRFAPGSANGFRLGVDFRPGVDAWLAPSPDFSPEILHATNTD